MFQRERRAPRPRQRAQIIHLVANGICHDTVGIWIQRQSGRRAKAKQNRQQRHHRLSEPHPRTGHSVRVPWSGGQVPKRSDDLDHVILWKSDDVCFKTSQPTKEKAGKRANEKSVCSAARALPPSFRRKGKMADDDEVDAFEDPEHFLGYVLRLGHIPKWDPDDQVRPRTARPQPAL